MKYKHENPMRMKLNTKINKHDMDKLVRWAVDSDLEKFAEDAYGVTGTAFEVASNGITVNNVLPGFTNTERLSSLIQSKRSSVKMATLEVKGWDGVHPTSGSRVVGTIVILTEANNEIFNPTPSKSTNNDGNTKRSDFLESEELPGSDI